MEQARGFGKKRPMNPFLETDRRGIKTKIRNEKKKKGIRIGMSVHVVSMYSRKITTDS